MNDTTRQRTSVPPEVAGQRQSQDHPESCGSTQPAAVPAYQPMTDEEAVAIVREASRGAATRRDGTTSTRIVRATESAVLARVAAAPAAAPVAWVRYCSDGTIEGPILDGDRRMDEVRKKSGAWTPLVAAARAAVQPVAQGEREPTWVLLSRPGMSAVRKGPFHDRKLTEQMLRDLYELHPDATCLVIDAPHTTYPTDGREWASMYGDQRRKPIPRAAAPAAVPSAVLAWRDAFAAYLAASERYNTRLAAIRAREAQFPNEFGRDNPEAEWHAMNAAEKLHRSLIAPMYGALTAAAPAAAPVTQDEREACAKWLVSYWRQKGFGERLTDAEMMAGHERSGQLEVASAAWSAAIRAAAPAAVQPVAQQQPSVHQVAGVGLPSQAVRTGGEGA